MSTLPEQFSAARKAQVEFQLEFARKFSAKVAESTQKVIALNLETGRASMEKSAAALRQLLEAKDPRDLFALTTQTQASFDSLLAYSRELIHIASGAQGELLKTVTQRSLAATPFALAAPLTAPLAAAPFVAAPFVTDDAPTDAELENLTELVTAPVEAGQHFASAAAEAVRDNVATASEAVQDNVAVASEAVQDNVAAASEAVQENVAKFQQEVEVEVEVAAKEVQEITEPVVELADAELTPIAEAISEAVSEPEPITLASAPFVVDNHVEITGMTPVDAAPPAVSSTPFVEKQELTQGKSRKKK